MSDNEVSNPAKKGPVKKLKTSRPKATLLTLEQQVERNRARVTQYRATADRLELEANLLEKSGDLRITAKQRKLDRIKAESQRLQAEIDAASA
jgi:hypothetical protein